VRRGILFGDKALIFNAWPLGITMNFDPEFDDSRNKIYHDDMAARRLRQNVKLFGICVLILTVAYILARLYAQS
jgi:hypothetical protein